MERIHGMRSVSPRAAEPDSRDVQVFRRLVEKLRRVKIAFLELDFHPAAIGR